MEIAKIIDHTNLRADATEEAIVKLCKEAKQYEFRSVCVNPRWAKLAKAQLKGTNIKVVVVVDWPNGASPNDVRLFQAERARKDGADEIDPVLDIGNFKMGNYDLVLSELRELAKILPVKLIIETGYLTDEEIKKAAVLVKNAGCYCVKTSTGQEPKVDIDAKVEHIKLIKEAVGPDFPIKAAGGIKTMGDAKRAVEAGANIIGTSSGLKIIGISNEGGDY
ncbi:MAG: deoxyribose-phosphate aldolase [Candidatus Nealsonbacteria bacterium]|nr:deoxyribose-phosphate aldolase [Candidatus Nealsonbacteria bacterium]